MEEKMNEWPINNEPLCIEHETCDIAHKWAQNGKNEPRMAKWAQCDMQWANFLGLLLFRRVTCVVNNMWIRFCESHLVKCEAHKRNNQILELMRWDDHDWEKVSI